MSFLLIAGVIGAVALLLRKKNGTTEPGIGATQPGTRPTTAGGFSAAQLQQIQKFSAIAVIAGTATTAGVAALTTLTFAAAGPIGAAVAGVIAAIGIFRGTAHNVAKEWVEKVQDPFHHDFLAPLVDAKDAAIQNGTASKAMLIETKRAIQALWSQYKQTAEIFAQNGDDYRLVIDQSYETLDYRYVNGRPVGTGLITRILADIDRQIEEQGK